jgi:hypothetical protein
MADAAKRPLKVSLELKWNHKDVYDAKVTVTVIGFVLRAGEASRGSAAGEGWHTRNRIPDL